MKRLMAYVLPALLAAGVPIQSRAQEALTASPSSAVVQAGQPITFTASGGTPFYYWDAGGNSSASPTTGFGATFTVTYSLAGFNSLTLTDSTGAMFTVNVQVTSIASCQPAAVPNSFRFYTAYINDSGFGTPNFPDAIAQTAGDSNTVWVGSQSGTPDQIADADVTAICEASHTGRPVILELDDLCFSNGLLRSDWQARLARWTDRLMPYQANIAGLYPIDEPYEQAALLFHIPVSTMYQQLVAVTGQIKAKFPSIPTMVIVQGYTIETLQPIPSTYDFVGFDFYAPFDGSTNGGHGVVYFETRLEGMLLPSQRTFLVPWAWAFPTEVTSSKLYITAVERIKEAALYHDFAVSNPRIVGFMPFLFQDVTDSGGSGKGVHGIPGLHAAYQTVFQALKTERPQ